jgi:hypothetical protein
MIHFIVEGLGCFGVVLRRIIEKDLLMSGEVLFEPS